MTPADYIQAMRRFPGAVNVVTTGTGDARTGLTATAVMSLTAEPPQVAVAVNRKAGAHPRLLQNGFFCVNTLGAEHSEVARRFSGGARGIERFAGETWMALATGAPVLADAVISLDCRIVRTVELSTHDLFIGAVVAIRENDPARPLLYVDGEWASLLPGSRPDLDRIMGVVGASTRALEQATSSGSDTRRQLKEFAYQFSLLNIEQQAITQEYVKSELYFHPESLSKLNAARREFDSKVLDFIRQGVAQGEFDVEDSQIASFAILGMMIWVFRWYRPDGRLSPEEVSRRLAELVERVVSSGGGRRAA